jgi:hypothetical protein
MAFDLAARPTLHVMNGDAMRPIFAGANLPGVMTVYADALHEGPVPADLSDAQLREVRARYIAGPAASWEMVAEGLRQWAAPLEAFDQYDEVVLWFEHDLFDQLLLIRHLAWFAGRSLGRTRLSLICIGSFPGREPFRGLGELGPTQLASLFDTRIEVTAAQKTLGLEAWRAFTSEDPRSLEPLFDAGRTALPFLGPALRRHAQEFPAIDSGLPRTEHEILSLLADRAQSPVALFHEESRRESCFFIGDAQFRWRLDALAAAPEPLITMELEPGDTALLPRGTVSITETGRRVLSSRTDWLAVASFDRWLGGVHLRPGAMWRWDDARRAFRAPTDQ